MLVTSQIRGQIPVAHELVVQNPKAARSFVWETASNEVVMRAKEIGVFVNPESVWVFEPQEDETTWQLIYQFYWCPDPTTGVEFHGGPIDGQKYALPRQDDGAPYPFHVSPGMPQEPDYNVDYSEPISPLATFRYERRGINSQTDRWWYQYMP